MASISQLQRASLFAAIEESTYGVLEFPTDGVPFMPLKSGFGQTPAREVIESDEIINDIAPTKGQGGLENPTGKHNINLKASGVEGQAPEWGVFLKSCLGASFTKAAETVLAGGSTAGDDSAAPLLKVADSSIYRVGMAMLGKDLVNGYWVRNIVEIVDSTTLKLNFNLPAAPAAGVKTGIPVLFYPVATGHPSFSALLYNANGAAISAIAGCRTSDFAMTVPAANKVTAEVSYGGKTFYWNPLNVTASNKFIDIKDFADVSYSTSVAEGIYRKPQDLALAIENALNALASTDTFTVKYINFGTDAGKFKITDAAGIFKILFKTGAHGSDNTDTHIGTLIGFSDAADKTGAASYTSDLPITLSAAYAPIYDSSSFIVAKKGQVWIGDFNEAVCRDAEQVKITIATPQENVTSICSDGGLLEKLILKRNVKLEATLITPKYESGMFDKFIENRTTQAMINIGPKDAAQNWIPGSVINAYMAQATITQLENPSGDILKTNVTMDGFVSATLKDFYVNAA